MLDQTTDGLKICLPSKWIVFDQLILIEDVRNKYGSSAEDVESNANCFIKCASVVSPITILLMAGSMRSTFEINNLDIDHCKFGIATFFYEFIMQQDV